MNITIIDNYNLSHLIKELGATVTVLRNDRFKLDELEACDRILLSPGPGIPEEAGLLMEVIRHYAGKKPILGVCLGEQAKCTTECKAGSPSWRTTRFSKDCPTKPRWGDTTRGQ